VSPTTLESLSDVLIPSPVNGDTIKYNGVQWANVNFSTTAQASIFTAPIAINQIAVGSGANTLTGTANLLWDQSTFTLTVGGQVLLGGPLGFSPDSSYDIGGGGNRPNKIITAGDATIGGGLGVNGASPQTAYVSTAPPATGGTGVTAGAFDSAIHRDALITAVANIITALKNNGIMS
jgi:hypothetical protein